MLGHRPSARRMQRLLAIALLFAGGAAGMVNDYCSSFAWDPSLSLDPTCPPCRSVWDKCQVSNSARMGAKPQGRRQACREGAI
jgi:hypothetical protein